MTADPLRLSEAVAEFLLHQEAAGRHPDTLYNYRLILCRHLPAVIGDPDLAAITPGDLDRFIVYLRRRIAPSTLHVWGQWTRCFFNWCVARGYCDASPVTVKIERAAPEPLRNLAFSDAEVSRLLDACADDVRLNAIVRFLLDTGCRANELCTLRIDDLDLEACAAFVLGKGSRRRKLIYTADTRDAVRAWLRVRPDVAHVGVFLNQRNRALRKHMLWRWLQHLGKAADVENVRAHRFRHTVGRRFSQAGAPLTVTQAKLGHADAQTTARYYLNSCEDDVRRFSEQVAGG